MKKLKLNLVLIALVLGVTGAVAFKPASHKSHVSGAALYWFDSQDGDGASSANSSPETDAQRIEVNNCDGSINFCEAGYTGSQLNTANVPSSGVKSTEVMNVQETIFLHDN